MSDQRIFHLVHKIFIGLDEGQELLKLLKDKSASEPIFPKPAEAMAQYGGALGWAAYQEGQRSFMLGLELMAKEYEQQIDASNRKKK